MGVVGMKPSVGPEGDSAWGGLPCGARVRYGSGAAVGVPGLLPSVGPKKRLVWFLAGGVGVGTGGEPSSGGSGSGSVVVSQVVRVVWWVIASEINT